MFRTRVTGFQFTSSTKANAVESLALAFERSQIVIANDPVLIDELMSYEMERLASGLTRYNAPEGMHDDTVMALTLAWHLSGSGIGQQRSFRIEDL